MKKILMALVLIWLPACATGASDPIAADAKSGTFSGKITRVESDRIEVSYGANANDTATVYVDGSTRINGSSPSIIDRVFGGVLGRISDLRRGDDVTVSVTRTDNKLMADTITTQTPTVAGGSQQGGVSKGPTPSDGAPQTNRVCVRDERAIRSGEIVCGEMVR
jgi:hypothetical protein